MTTFATQELDRRDLAIAQTEEQIQRLQQLLSQQQSERQNVQSIEQMGMSAIEQILKTLAACQSAGLPTLADNFREQVQGLLDSGEAIAQLPPEEPPAEPTPQPPTTEPPTTETDVVDVEVEVETEATQPKSQQKRSPQPAPQPASVGAAAAADIGLMDFNELKTYCLDTLGLSKDDVRKRGGKLTTREAWEKAATS